MANGREILYQDQEITIYPATGKERLYDGGRHLIVVVNRHLESIYDFVGLPRGQAGYSASWQSAIGG